MQTRIGRGALRALPVLNSLNENELDALYAALTWRSIRSGEAVLSHLERDDDVFFLVKGALQFRLPGAHGRSVVFSTLREGGYFGEIAALTGAPRTLTVAAETDSVVGVCPKGVFLSMMRANAGFSADIAVALARRVALLTDRVFELATLEVRFRVYAELARLARRGEQTNAGVRLTAPTHATLAAAIGAQREAVTRELRQLAREGVLKQKGRELTICDLDRLKSLARRRGGVTATQLVDWA